MDKYIQIKERYQQGMITYEQLQRYVGLKVITQEQADKIKNGSIAEQPAEQEHSVAGE